jgi:hypothetical protein
MFGVDRLNSNIYIKMFTALLYQMTQALKYQLIDHESFLLHVRKAIGRKTMQIISLLGCMVEA